VFPEGDLSQLDLWPKEVVAISKLPWGGRSPRALTRGHLGVILKAQAEKSVSDFVDPDQLEIWVPVKRAPRYAGAPTLLPLQGD